MGVSKTPTRGLEVFFSPFFAIYLKIDFFWSKKYRYDVRGVSLKKIHLILVLSRFDLFCATFDISNAAVLRVVGEEPLRDDSMLPFQ